MTLSGVVLDCPDPQSLAGFYEELLGWRRIQDEPGWVKLAGPEGGAGLSFQQEDRFVPPTWPAGPGAQQMQVHLDIHVDDLDVAGARDRRWRPARGVPAAGRRAGLPRPGGPPVLPVPAHGLSAVSRLRP